MSARPAIRVAGGALSLLGVLSLGFAGHIALLSQAKQEQAQQAAYADFRKELANATAPTGQTGADGRLHEPGTPVAILKIPALKVRDVVFEGTLSGVLEKGPGHRRDTVLPGQSGTSVILGRRISYGAPFRDLDLLNSGDEITVITGQGEHTYRVLGVRRTGDLEPPALAAGAGRLILVTADGQPFFPNQLIQVDADLTSQPAGAAARPLKVLPAGEEPLGTDQSAWMPLLLWGQAFTGAAFGLAWARLRWGRLQAWVVGVPVLTALGLTIADQVARLLPNLL
ncbi:sortase [Longispora albida]|uniref:sortase n=1 Tax=Longispora albida TaxID=203523 RepID=UPI0003AA7BDE|nr:class E sortase [Longispora albida]